jgi:hypothetical protein
MPLGLCTNLSGDRKSALGTDKPEDIGNQVATELDECGILGHHK